MHLNTKIKIGLSVLVVAALVLGGVSSLSKEKRTFYKGKATFGNVLLTSVLTAEDDEESQTAKTESEDFFKIAQENKNRLSAAADDSPEDLTAPTAVMQSPRAQLIFLPAPADAEVTPESAPAITLTPSCESQNRFTYTGPDQPDLLYGMCIECETMVFMENNWVCPNNFLPSEF